MRFPKCSLGYGAVLSFLTAATLADNDADHVESECVGEFMYVKIDYDDSANLIQLVAGDCTEADLNTTNLEYKQNATSHEIEMKLSIDGCNLQKDIHVKAGQENLFYTVPMDIQLGRVHDAYSFNLVMFRAIVNVTCQIVDNYLVKLNYGEIEHDYTQPAQYDDIRLRFQIKAFSDNTFTQQVEQPPNRAGDLGYFGIFENSTTLDQNKYKWAVSNCTFDIVNSDGEIVHEYDLYTFDQDNCKNEFLDLEQSFYQGAHPSSALFGISFRIFTFDPTQADSYWLMCNVRLCAFDSEQSLNRCEEVESACSTPWICADGKYGATCEHEFKCADQKCNSNNTDFCTDNALTGYNCTCNFNAKGEHCDELIYASPCVTGACQNGGTCNWLKNDPGNPADDTFNCTCPVGFLGEKCERADACHNVDCSGQGTCSDHGDGVGKTCTCNEGYFGDNCENRYKCHESPCQNNATCVNAADNLARTCNCTTGYIGDSCERVDVCLTADCGRGANCTDSGNSVDYTCQCEHYWIDDGDKKCSKKNQVIVFQGASPGINIEENGKLLNRTDQVVIDPNSGKFGAIAYTQRIGDLLESNPNGIAEFRLELVKISHSECGGVTFGLTGQNGRVDLSQILTQTYTVPFYDENWGYQMSKGWTYSPKQTQISSLFRKRRESSDDDRREERRVQMRDFNDNTLYSAPGCVDLVLMLNVNQGQQSFRFKIDGVVKDEISIKSGSDIKEYFIHVGILSPYDAVRLVQIE